MKIKNWLFFLGLSGFIINSHAQIPIINVYNLNVPHEYKTETFTNSEKITGQPYLIDQWYKGIITLENGETYTNYLLKYNTYNQTLVVKQGVEIIEIEQKIKEFILDVDKYKKIRFINLNVYGSKTVGYYELVDENTKCQLLRFNKKVGESNSEKFTNLTESKTFQTTIEYFIFNKASNKLTSYKKADPTLKALYELHLL